MEAPVNGLRFTLIGGHFYRQHVERYHGKKMETGFLCPSPGCNNWAVSEESLVTHIANYHKVRYKKKICMMLKSNLN